MALSTKPKNFGAHFEIASNAAQATKISSLASLTIRGQVKCQRRPRATYELPKKAKTTEPERVSRTCPYPRLALGIVRCTLGPAGCLPVAAEYCGIGPATLRREDPNPVRIGRKRLIWLKEDLDAWLDRQAGRSSVTDARKATPTSITAGRVIRIKGDPGSAAFLEAYNAIQHEMEAQKRPAANEVIPGSLRARGDTADIEHRLRHLEGKRVADTEMAQKALEHNRADEIANTYGDRAPGAMPGEPLLDYQVRLAGRFQKHSKACQHIKLAAVARSDAAAFQTLRDQIYADALAVAFEPATICVGILREVAETDQAGRRIIRFYGDNEACWGTFKSPKQRVVGINKEDERSGEADALLKAARGGAMAAISALVKRITPPPKPASRPAKRPMTAVQAIKFHSRIGKEYEAMRRGK